MATRKVKTVAETEIRIKESPDQALRKLQAKHRAIGKQIEAVNAKSASSFAKARASVNGFGSSVQSLARAGGVVAIMASISSEVRKSVSAFSALQKASAEVSTLGAIGLKKATDEAKRLSAAFGGSAVEQAKGLYQAISAGSTDAAKTMEAANKLAIGGVTDISTAVDGLTSIVNAYGLSVDDSSMVSDQLFQAMKDGKTTIGELSGSIGQVASLANNAGVGLHEILGAIVEITKKGVSTSEAVTQIRSALVGLTRRGVDVSLKGLAGTFQELRSSMSTQELGKFLGRVEGLNAILNTAATDGGRSFREEIERIKFASGETDKAVSKMAETFEFKTERMNASLGNFRASIGELIATKFSPTIDGWTLSFNYLANAINESKQEADDLAAGIKAIESLGGSSFSQRFMVGEESVRGIGRAQREMQAREAKAAAANGAVPAGISQLSEEAFSLGQSPGRKKNSPVPFDFESEMSRRAMMNFMGTPGGAKSRGDDRRDAIREQKNAALETERAALAAEEAHVRAAQAVASAAGILAGAIQSGSASGLLAGGLGIAATFAGPVAAPFLSTASGIIQGFSSGGVVPMLPGASRGRDSVIAALTPGEEVIRADDPRHRANRGGGGSVVVNISNTIPQSRAEIDRIVRDIISPATKRMENLL